VGREREGGREGSEGERGELKEGSSSWMVSTFANIP